MSETQQCGSVPHSTEPHCASGLYLCVHWQQGSHSFRNITLQIPLSQDVLSVGVPQPSVHMSHMEMEVLIAQWDVEQEEASSDYSCQL